MKKTQLSVIETNKIDSDIPVLLSQAAMKWADMNLNSQDTTSVFGEIIRFSCYQMQTISYSFNLSI